MEIARWANNGKPEIRLYFLFQPFAFRCCIIRQCDKSDCSCSMRSENIRNIVRLRWRQHIVSTITKMKLNRLLLSQCFRIFVYCLLLLLLLHVHCATDCLFYDCKITRITTCKTCTAPCTKLSESRHQYRRQQSGNDENKCRVDQVKE